MQLKMVRVFFEKRYNKYVIDHKRIVQLLLSRPSLDLDIKNNDNKLAYDLAANSEIKRIFEAFIAEKNILNSNFTKKVTIHNTKAESIQKMFESAMSNKHPMQLQQTRSTENVPNKVYLKLSI